MSTSITASTLSRPHAAPASQRTFEQPAGDTVAVSELWRILWHRRRLILAVMAVALAAAAVYALVTPTLYTATAQILVDPRDRQVVSNDVNPSTVSPDGGVTQVESQASVIQSNNVLSRAIDALDLTHDPEFSSPGVLAPLLDALGLGSDAASADRIEARTLTALRRQMTVKRADKVLVIDVAVSAKGADKAARIVNAIADAYLADQADARRQSADDASQALTASLSAQRARVQEAENAVQRYKVAHDIVVSTGQAVTEQQLNDVNSQLATAQNRVSTLKAQIDQIQRQRAGGASEDATAEALQSPVIAKLRETESTIAQRAAYQAIEYGPRHPAVAAVAGQLRDVRRLINAELDRIARSARADYDRSVAGERALEAKLDSLKRQTQDHDQAAVGLRELQGDLDAVRTIYASYLSRAQETREQSSIDSTNARIITHALPPQQSSWPPLAFFFLGALGGGLGVGAGLALVLEYAGPTVLSRGQAETLADAPVIGVLPGAVTKAADDMVAQRTDAILGLALRRMFSPARVRTGVRSVLLTSAPSEAAVRRKAAWELALVAVSRGERVLFIDAGAMGKGQPHGAGLVDVLRGESRLDLAFRLEAVGPVEAGCVMAVMGPGRPSRMLPEAAAGASAVRLMAEAAQVFDFIVVDGGAPMETLQAAAMLSAVGEVVLVATLNATPQHVVSDTVDALRTMGRDVGAVLLADPLARQ